jgi:GH25 family lysozyme M1 (1,4-beta-N-acetylmuramidase)
VGVRIEVRRRLLALLAAVSAGVAAAALPAAPAAGATPQAKGIDVSHWNGVIDWIRVAGGGYRFVFGKATEGFTLTDPTYSVNRAGTEGFGLKFGAYHFARPSGTTDAAATASATEQADHFVDVAQPAKGELPPVLDLEAKGGLGPARLKLWAQAWLNEVYARAGVHGLVYSSPNFWKTAVANTSDIAAGGTRLWVAHWTKSPVPLVPAQNWAGQGWTFWQWTDCSTVPGFAHCSDGDRMNGSDPATVTISAYPRGAPVPSTPPSLVGTAQVGKLLAAVPGLWGGGKPVRFAYQWQRCDAAGQNCAAISGAIADKYTPAAGDVGRSLTVVVSATGSDGSASAVSAPSSTVAAAGTKPTARPTVLSQPQVSGLAQAGQTLTADVGAWTGSPSSFAYQWRRCDGSGAACVAIAGATGTTYAPTPGDIGATLSLVVTATGAGGVASAVTGTTATVAAAPLPEAVAGSQVAQPGIAGNVRSEDGRASVTWQPGAVPDGLTMILAPFVGTLSIAASEVALGVDGLPPGGFPWPVDIAYAAPPPAGTVLGYSTDATIYAPVPALAGAQLPADTTIGSYVQDGIVHVLTRVPVRLALFRAGQWGDPSLSSVQGPTLVQQTPVHLLPRRDGSVLVLARLATPSQVQLYATVFAKGSVRLAILPAGSRLGTWLKPGPAPKTAHVRLSKPGGIAVRLRLNGRSLRHGTTYRLRVVAIDPWGRRDMLTLPFVYR